MLQETITNLHRYLNTFFDTFPFDHAERIIATIAKCQGMLFLTGAGKSGHIAQKIAATLTSTGTQAAFLCPHQAVHGDLGRISSKDIALLFSKSGETEELLSLLASLKRKGAFTIAAVSVANSRLSQRADLSIYLPVEKELCPYDLAPTTSCIVQLIFGDCLAMELMRLRQFSLADFALNHPSGFIGRKIGFTVSDLMLQGDKIPVCRAQDRLIDLLHELSTKKCGCLLVKEEGKLVGIFTDGDLRRAIQTLGLQGLTMKIEELMTKNPRTIQPERFAFEALHCMEDPHRPVTVLPVVHKENLVGLIRMHDILQAKLKS